MSVFLERRGAYSRRRLSMGNGHLSAIWGSIWDPLRQSGRWQGKWNAFAARTGRRSGVVCTCASFMRRWKHAQVHASPGFVWRRSPPSWRPSEPVRVVSFFCWFVLHSGRNPSAAARGRFLDGIYEPVWRIRRRLLDMHGRRRVFLGADPCALSRAAVHALMSRRAEIGRIASYVAGTASTCGVWRAACPCFALWRRDAAAASCATLDLMQNSSTAAYRCPVMWFGLESSGIKSCVLERCTQCIRWSTGTRAPFASGYLSPSWHPFRLRRSLWRGNPVQALSLAKMAQRALRGSGAKRTCVTAQCFPTPESVVPG